MIRIISSYAAIHKLSLNSISTKHFVSENEIKIPVTREFKFRNLSDSTLHSKNFQTLLPFQGLPQ